MGTLRSFFHMPHLWLAWLFLAASLPGCTLDIFKSRVSAKAIHGLSGANALCGREGFQQVRDSVLLPRCATCHNGTNPSAPAFAQADSDAAYEVAVRVAGRIPERAGTPHAGCTGPCNLTRGNPYRDLLEQWAAQPTDASCPSQTSDPGTSLSRASGLAMASRVGVLFPAVDVNYYILSPYYEAVQFSRADRPLNATSMITLGTLTSMLCSQDLSRLLSTQGILMSGETLDPDPASRKAMAAARNGWLYPYKANSKEVQLLASLYRDVIAAGKGEALAERTVCRAIFMAPQFWLGTPYEHDAVRRLALDLAGRIPSFSEYDAVMSGRMSKDEFVKKLQSEEGYYSVVGKAWLKEWLGLRGVYPYWSTKPDVVHYDPRSHDSMRRNRVKAGGFSFVTGTYFGMERREISGGDPRVPWSIWRNQEGMMYGFYQDSEAPACENYAQPFDPRTVRIEWQHRNPVLGGAWETVAAWVKQNDGNWSGVPGAVTLADGVTRKTTTLADIRIAQMTHDYNLPKAQEPFRYRYAAGGLVGTPLETFGEGDRRAIRYAPSGPQTGFSLVKLTYSRQPVYVCNQISRFLATASWRPCNPADAAGLDACKRRVSELAGAGRYAIDGAPPDTWTAEMGRVDLYNYDTFYHPKLLEQFRAGRPDLAEISRPAGTYSEAAAYPLGYDPSSISPTVPNQASLNDVAINVAISAEPGTDEGKALTLVISDIENEVYNIARYLMERGEDFRQFVNGNFTVGHAPYAYMLNQQFWWLPGDLPGGNLPKPGEQGYLDEKLSVIQGSALTGFSPNLMRNAFGEHNSHMPAPAPLKELYAQPSLLPKPMSGILTTAAFLAPVSPKARTVAARYFLRLLKSDPASIQLTSSQKSLHDRYVPAIENGGEHVNRQECLACHRNIDALASALSGAFSKYPNQYGTDGIGEMMPTWVDNIVNNPFWGLQGSGPASTGAYLGRTVTGVREVGAVTASSREFAEAVVMVAMENIYGRNLNAADREQLAVVTDHFISGGYNYNSMIREIATSVVYWRHN